MNRTSVTFASPLTVDLGEGEPGAGRTIAGLAVPFGQASAPSVDGARYRFAGAPANVEELVDVVRGHDDDAVIGRLAAAFAVDEAGLGATARIFRTSAGTDALEEAREGVLAGFSVSAAIASYTEGVDGIRDVPAGAWSARHLGIVRKPAFAETAGLTVAAASAAPTTTGGAMTAPTLTAEVVTMPTIAELAEQVRAAIGEELAQAGRTGVHPLARFRSHADYVVAMAAAEPEEASRLQAAFAVADQITTDNPGVIPPGWRTEIKMNLDARRPAIAGTGGPISLPDAGMDANWPYFAGSLDAIIAKQVTQKTALSGPKISILKASEPIETAGVVTDISYQLLLRSSPSYLNAYLSITTAAWARYTEALYEGALVARAGATMPLTGTGTDGAALAAGIWAASSAVEDATGAPATIVGVSSDVWIAIGKLTKFINPGYGPSNAVGAANAATLRAEVNGLQITRWPFLPAATGIVTNDQAARFAEYGPQVASSEDVVKLGRNVATWGMYELAEVYFPAGVIKLTGVTTPLDESAPASK